MEGVFGFSIPDEEVPPALGAGKVDDPLSEARARAFRMLDEWMTWIYVFDDESIFSQESDGGRKGPYRFVLDDVITEPVDVLRYSLKTASLLF